MTRWIWFACWLFAYPVRADAGAPAFHLGLHDALARAQRDPPSVLEAAARAQAQRSEVAAAEAAYLPTLNVRLSETLAHARRDEGAELGKLSDATHGAGLDAHWTLLDFGRRAAVIAAESAQLRADRAGTRSAAESAALAVAEQYLRVVANQGLNSVGSEDVADRQQLLQGVQALADRGLWPAVDAVRARAEVIRAETRLRLIETRAAYDRKVLSITLGLDPQRSFLVDAAGADVCPWQAEQLADLSEPARAAVERAPELARARAGYDRALGDARAAERAKLPGVFASGAAALSRSDVLGKLGTNSMGRYAPIASTFDASIAIGLEWQAFDLSVWDRATAAQARVAAEREHVRDALRTRQLDVERVLQQLRSASLDLRQAAELSELSKLSVVAEKERYIAGQGSLLHVLDAQRLWQEARMQRVQAQLDRDVACVWLALLSGHAIGTH